MLYVGVWGAAVCKVVLEARVWSEAVCEVVLGGRYFQCFFNAFSMLFQEYIFFWKSVNVGCGGSVLQTDHRKHAWECSSLRLVLILIGHLIIIGQWCCKGVHYLLMRQLCLFTTNPTQTTMVEYNSHMVLTTQLATNNKFKALHKRLMKKTIMLWMKVTNT